MDFRTKHFSSTLPLVTIGVSSYNYSMYIDAALNSLLQQTYPYIELIIIDDCSVDDCPAKIEQWIMNNNITCTYIHHAQNIGITKTSNEIVSLAKGKYISLFATDDIMLPEKIEKQVALMEANGDDYGMCYTNVQLMDEAGNDLGFYDKSHGQISGDVLEAFVFGDLQFCTPSALIRSDVYRNIGLYDERVLLEDYNFWLRVFGKYKAAYCDYPGIIYRIKKQSAIYSEWMKNDQERYYYDRIISNFQALHYTQNKRVKSHLRLKISQYMKSLSATGSSRFSELFKYLLVRGYFRLPYKSFAAQKLRRLKA